ncbi:MAG: ferredoxin [Asgard group archaeon]|nr:ferredoxin [Asgard group archaeon]
MAKEPRVNVHECCGCGICVYALPEVFRLSPDGTAVAYSPESASKKEITKVINDCPVNCIHWYEKPDE